MQIVLMHEGKVIRHAETMEICQDEEALKEAELEIPGQSFVCIAN